MIGRSTATILICLIARLSTATADGPTDEKARAAEFLELARSEAAAYAFEDESGARLALQPEPILRWSNPVVGSIQGDVFVWTSKGRPLAVGSFHKWYAPFTHRTNEFVSLSTGPLVVNRDGARVWTPPRGAVEWKPIPEAPTPAASASQRLRQMRAIAAEFTASGTDRKEVDRHLRLLSQPIYRYAKTEGDLVDGALFAFALGTDPDALLMIEDRVVDGVPRWQFAMARMSRGTLRAAHRGREVWNLPTLNWKGVDVSRESYISFRFEKVETAPPIKP